MFKIQGPVIRTTKQVGKICKFSAQHGTKCKMTKEMMCTVTSPKPPQGFFMFVTGPHCSSTLCMEAGLPTGNFPQSL